MAYPKLSIVASTAPVPMHFSSKSTVFFHHHVLPLWEKLIHLFSIFSFLWYTVIFPSRFYDHAINVFSHPTVNVLKEKKDTTRWVSFRSIQIENPNPSRAPPQLNSRIELKPFAIRFTWKLKKLKKAWTFVGNSYLVDCTNHLTDEYRKTPSTI